MENQPALIRQEMQQTRTALTEKLETLEQQVLGTAQSATAAVQETVATVKDAVQGTVHSVKDSIDDTVGTVKETFDLEQQVQRHPWVMLGSAVGVGFLSGRLLQSLAPPPLRAVQGLAPAAQRIAAPPESKRPAAETARPTLLARFEPEIDKLRGLAISAVFNVVKDVVKPHVPRSVEPQLVEILDSVMRKLGGEPLRGSRAGV
jgi:ElaB/YqjD/DUF883 family membrane-anchored ribosome-binding protein